jgi:hypothetical protein
MIEGFFEYLIRFLAQMRVDGRGFGTLVPQNPLDNAKVYAIF